MTDKTWKAHERRIAKKFGTVRTPLSGGNSKMTQSDTLHKTFYIEDKTRARFAVLTVMHDAEKKAKKEGKIPLVVIHEHRAKQDYVIISLDNFIKLKDI